MAKQTGKCFCSKCGQPHDVEYYASVDAQASPELKEKLLSGELFTWTCPHCGTLNLASYPFLYHDPQNQLMLVLTQASMNAEGLPEGYHGRIVRSVGELIEKIKIFDAGLDDVVVEMCKFITVKELGKQVELKFLKLDGADMEITFTYPENGNMEMIVTGLNVYEDCAGILSRNPQISESVRGLVCINSEWLRNFFE